MTSNNNNLPPIAEQITIGEQRTVEVGTQTNILLYEKLNEQRTIIKTQDEEIRELKKEVKKLEKEWEDFSNDERRITVYIDKLTCQYCNRKCSATHLISYYIGKKDGIKRQVCNHCQDAGRHWKD